MSDLSRPEKGILGLQENGYVEWIPDYTDHLRRSDHS